MKQIFEHAVDGGATELERLTPQEYEQRRAQYIRAGNGTPSAGVDAAAVWKSRPNSIDAQTSWSRGNILFEQGKFDAAAEAFHKGMRFGRALADMHTIIREWLKNHRASQKEAEQSFLDASRSELRTTQSGAQQFSQRLLQAGTLA